MDLTTDLIRLVIVGILSGGVSAIIALRRYKHEKWWEMRVNAYKAVIESLSDLTAIYEQRNRSWQQSPIEPENIRNELAIAFGKIRKHRDMGGFLFSIDAEAALTDFIKFEINYESVTDPSDIYGPLAYSSRKCLDRIVAFSKKDLV